MTPGTGIKPRRCNTQTACSRCRERKVKCDEVMPACGTCCRLFLPCFYDLSILHTPHKELRESQSPFHASLAKQYTNHFLDHCSRFLIYPHDDTNPFQISLRPLATSSAALLYSSAAIAAGHLSRTEDQYGLDFSQHQHKASAAYFYTRAVTELRLAIERDASSDAALGACLLLCVYEISYSKDRHWLCHLEGAKRLIAYRGGPRPNDYLTRFFSYLYISGSLFSGRLSFPGKYWAEDAVKGDETLRWPLYDSEGSVADRTSTLMAFLSSLSRSSSDTTNFDRGGVHLTLDAAAQFKANLQAWYDSCKPEFPDQTNDWRTSLPTKLNPLETLKNEAFSRTKLCVYGCIIYLHQITFSSLPFPPQDRELVRAVNEIFDIAERTPNGHGLEIGLYWGLFMAGVTIFNEVDRENFIRWKMRSDSKCVFHADSALELLETLWAMQHKSSQKIDWRRVQDEIGSRLFILV